MAGASNSINESTTGVCGFTGTAFTGTPVTQYAVVVGGATSSTLGNVGPTATAGQVLQSAGSSANPAFSTATYPLTTTINQILYSSSANTVTGLATANRGVLTTGTTGIPVITALATDGQLIIGSTAGAPAAATLTAGTGITITNASNSITIANSSTFAPNSTIQLFDDFCCYTITGSQVSSNLIWEGVSVASSWQAGTSDNGHPGVISSKSMTSSNRFMIASQNISNSGGFILGGGAITANFVLNLGALSTVTNRYILYFGLGDSVSTSDQANGVYFTYTDNVNSGNWVGKTASASSPSSANSAVAADTNYHNFKISVNAAATSVSFFIDGVQIANSPLSSTIPTTGISPFFNLVWSAGTVAANTLNIDLFYLSQTLTSTR